MGVTTASMAVETSPNSAPQQTATMSLAMMTTVRRGLARNVAVAVWWANSFVIASRPMSIANITPRNWPEVIMLVAIPASPAGVRAWAAWAIAWALSAPLIVLSGGYSVKWWLTPLVHNVAAVNSTTPVRNCHHVLVVRVFMIS